jgi:hypothetical protein
LVDGKLDISPGDPRIDLSSGQFAGKLREEPPLFHFQVKQRHSVGERIAEPPAREHHRPPGQKEGCPFPRRVTVGILRKSSGSIPYPRKPQFLPLQTVRGH